MGWCDFYDTGTELWICMFIRHDWDWLVDNWQDDIFTNKVFVAWVFGIDSDSRISKHGFWTSGRNF